VPRSAMVEASITENPSRESRHGEDHARLVHDGKDHVTGTIQT